MLFTKIVLPDGSVIASGPGEKNSIQQSTITQCVNSEDELRPGSTCAACVEAKIFVSDGTLNVKSGDELTVCKSDGRSDTKIGVFIAERPTQASANTYKLTAYDRVSKLDKDLSDWLKSLNKWPYKLSTFAQLVCSACGVTLVDSEIPNKDFLVNKFSRSGVTGRQLLQWCAELACRYCYANADGNIEFGWYAESGVTLSTSDFFAGALNYEDYTVAPIDAVKIRLSSSSSETYWPSDAAQNPYIILDNPLIGGSLTSATSAALQAMLAVLRTTAYTPCKVSTTSRLDLRPGHKVDIVDKNGKRISTVIMSKVQTGQRDTLESTGAPSRQSATAVNNKSSGRKAAEAASDAVAAQTQEDIFNKLTNNGAVQGFYVKNNKLYVNAEFVQILNLVAELITAGRLKSTDGLTYFDLDSGEMAAVNDAGVKTVLKDGALSLLSSDGTELLRLGHNNDNITYISFAPIGTRSQIYVIDGVLYLRTVDVDGSALQGRTLYVDHRVGWKVVNGETVLTAY